MKKQNKHNSELCVTKYVPTPYVIKIVLLFLLSLPLRSVAQGQLQIAEIGDFELQNGQTINDCKIGYRTFGKLNEDKSNAILFPTWYGGTGESLIPYLGPENMVDTTRYFVIIADAFGNGVSSSPSNSITQPGALFPEFSIRDMVHSQYKLVTEVLGLDRLYAVIGISMGGMQTYQWMASHPDFFAKAAPIVGTPQMTSYDLLLFNLLRRIMEQCEGSECTDITALGLMMEYLLGFTPEYRVRETSPGNYPELVKNIYEVSANYRLHDLLSQVKAICNYGITSGLKDSARQGPARFKGEVLITVSVRDQMLSPLPSKRLAEMIGADLLELESECGHYAFDCEKNTIGKAVRAFLK